MDTAVMAPTERLYRSRAITGGWDGHRTQGRKRCPATLGRYRESRRIATSIAFTAPLDFRLANQLHLVPDTLVDSWQRGHDLPAPTD